MRLQNLLGGGSFRDSCQTNKDSGQIVCKRVRMNKDGTATELAGFSMSLTGNCEKIMDNAFENEEGHLIELEKKFANRIAAKCQKSGKNIPSEF